METVTAIGGAILSASFQGLLDRLTSMDLLKYAGDGGLLEELKKWEKKLKKIYVVLDDAEEKSRANQLVKMWISDLRYLAYDVEDILDELATEAQLRKLKAEPLKRASKVRKLISSVSTNMNLSNVMFNAEMISKIERIGERLDEILRDKDDLHLGEFVRGGSGTSRVRERLPTTSVLEVNETKIYGREKDKEEIIELLRAESGDVNVSVIPIVGMGGVGKTTLAQLIFNDASLKFDFKAWVSVGEDFDVLRITKTILQPEDIDEKMDLNRHQMKLKEKLHQKKCLIVLDDVWNESYAHWTLLCGPFQGWTPGSRIIVTTRNESVSLMIGTVSAYSLKVLTQEKCLSVFAQHALGEANFEKHLHLEDIGKEFAKRCQGLPLAAKALGGLLRGKQNRNVWEEVLKNNLWDLPDDKCNILPALKLSYFHLPSNLKQCFAYCAVFPKDFEFDKDELILLWMAEGFVSRPSGMHELGCQYFNDLLSRSFFQKSSSDRSRYVMHDLIHDLAQSVNREICFHLGEKLKNANLREKIRHLSFISGSYDTWQKFDDLTKVQCLRTFLALPIMRRCSGKYYLSSKVLHEMVPKLRSSRVLSLADYNIVELPNSIGGLKHLRYLDLSRTIIKRIPEVKDHHVLQVLRL